MKPKYSLTAKAILSTVAYHDIHNYPLKESEVWRWLYFGWPVFAPAVAKAMADKKASTGRTVLESRSDEVSRSDFILGLQELVAQRILETKGGYYYLPGRQETVILRLERFELARKKWAIAQRAAKLLRTTPFIKLIAVGNTLSINNVQRESDIDFFIVTKDNRLWTNRFMVTSALEARDLRRHGEHIRDRVCLSFYLTEQTVDFRPLLLDKADPYFAFWIAQLVPLYDNGGWQILRRENAWLQTLMPNAFSYSLVPEIHDSSWTKALRDLREFFLLNWFGDRIEHFLRTAQRVKMKNNYHSLQNEPDTRVVIGKSIVKAHESDRRQEYKEKFRQRIESVLR